MKSGVYRIRNVVNGKCYVGSAANIKCRWSIHLGCLKADKHSRKFQNAWNKYGVGNFEFLIIEYCILENLVTREQHWIDFYDSFRKGYNTRPRAKNNLGVKFSPEACRKISEANKGKGKGVIRSPEFCRRNSEAQKGKTLSAEHRKRIGESNKGRILSAEHRRKIGEGNKGKIRSVEQRQAVSEANKQRRKN